MSTLDETFIVLLLLTTIEADRGARCITPNQENGICKLVLECQPIRDAIATLNTGAFTFAKESECGVDNKELLVCCGSLGNYKQEERFLVEQESIDFDDENDTSSHSLQFNEAKMKTIARISDKLPDKNICGIQNEDSRIVGGEITKINEFPWMVLLRYNNLDGSDAGFLCGGTLISNRYVLTAAHCLKGTAAEKYKIVSVRLGEWNITSASDCFSEKLCADLPEDVEIEKQVVHTNFSALEKDKDIALLRLARRIEFTDYIRPICLPLFSSTRLRAGRIVTVSGWGISENHTQSEVKMKVALPIITNHDCKEKYMKFNTYISDNYVCAGGEKKKDACKGDSGGPMMYQFSDGPLSGQWYQEGIVSKGIGCGAGFPGIYTRVSRFMDWILENLQS